jgi:DNA-binding transcriptional LysR family regulator
MNLRQLRAFQEVMLTGSMTEAARNMGRTQPAVSALIAGLEGTVGYQLFERRGGRLHPVPEAHFLLTEARSILDRVGSLRETMRGVGALHAGHLRIACMPVYAENLMPRLIARFVRSREDVSVSLVSQSSDRVYELMASQRFDLGFAEVATQSPLVDADEMAMDCVCAVSANDRLAKKSVITPADLDGRAMVSYLPQHFIRRQLEEIFDGEGRAFRVRFEVQNAASQYVFVEDRLACAIMSPLSAQAYRLSRPGRDRIAFIPFHPAVPYRLAILTPARISLSRLARAFAAALKEEAQSIVAG